jgi:uncharacterized protein YkwD
MAPKCFIYIYCALLFFSCVNQQRYTAGTTQSTELVELEIRVHTLVNDYRRSKRLPKLKHNSIITEYARRHSRNIARKKAAFSHEGYYSRVYEISKYLDGVSAGENIAQIQGISDVPLAALAGWLKSDGHRRLMEGNFKLTGIGAAKDTMGNYYFTQIFWR